MKSKNGKTASEIEISETETPTLTKLIEERRADAEAIAQEVLGPEFDVRQLGPDGVARQLLIHFGDRILMARGDMHNPMSSNNRAFVMNSKRVDGAEVGGTWDESEEAWRTFIHKMRRGVDEAIKQLASSAEKERAKSLRSMARLWRSLCNQHIDKKLPLVTTVFPFARQLLIDREHEYKEPYECSLLRLASPDALVWLGAPNGIVNLVTGEFISDAGEAAQHCIVGSLPDDFDDKAESEFVDKLFAHMDSELKQFLLQSLAYALRGNPQRTFLLLLGPPGGGKTSLFNALDNAFGIYSDAVNEDAFTRKRNNTGGLSPSVVSLIPPVRLALLPEANKAVYSTERLKAISGADTLSWRPLYQPPRKNRVTATVLMAANEIPKLDAADEALMARMRPVPYPQVPDEKRDEKMLSAFEGEHESAVRARQALTALIVKAGIGMKKKPEPPLQVEQEIERVKSELLGDVGIWLTENVVKTTERRNLSSTAI